MHAVTIRLLEALSLLRGRGWAVIGVLVVGMAITIWMLISAPSGFPVGHVIRIEEGVPLSRAADQLAEQRVLRSSFIFASMLRITGKDNDVDSGMYVFEKPLNLFQVASRLVNGEHGIAEVKVTLAEGMTVREMAGEIKKSIPDFDTETFIAEGTKSEGYLFPDTYFFMPDVTAQEALLRMRENFDVKTEELSALLATSKLTLDEAVILASLLEKEGRSFRVRQEIAGILMNRLEADMPLQVDAVFGYINKRDTYDPSLADLESDSPYNTYRFRGLPPGAINNPGIEALKAALTPIPSDYFYYLTDNDGVMRYARTFEEHKANRQRYGI